MPKNLIYICEHCSKFSVDVGLTNIHKYFPQAVHISGKEYWNVKDIFVNRPPKKSSGTKQEKFLTPK